MSLQHSAHSSCLKKRGVVFLALFCSFGSVDVWSEERVVYGFCEVNTALSLTESNKVKAPGHPAGMDHFLWENVFKKLGRA